MTTSNELKIIRYNGTERFKIVKAECFTIGKADCLTLWFEVETTATGAICCGDTSEYLRAPNAELGIPVSGFSVEGISKPIRDGFTSRNSLGLRHEAWVLKLLLEELLGRELRQPGTSDDDEDSCDSVFYYHEHQPLRDNKVVVLRQLADETVRIHWTARTQDVVDFRNPDAQIEIECDFHVRQ